MLYQANLFDKRVIVERELINGTVIRLLIEPVENERVRVLEYHRLSPKTNRFKRQFEQENKVLEFGKLGLSLSFADLFHQQTQAMSVPLLHFQLPL